MSILELGYPGVSRFFKYPIVFQEFQTFDDKRFGDIRIRSAPTIHSIPNLLYRLDFESGSFSVSGDGKLTDQALKLINGVGMHFQETYELKDRIPSHCSFEEVLRLHHARQANRIGITHIARDAIEPMKEAFEKYLKESDVDGSLFMTYPGQQFSF